MTDNYQPIYDAVRSRISNGDIGSAVTQAIHQSFDIGYLKDRANEAISIITNAYDRPSAVMRPKVFPDGNQWCALYGENIQDGVCGFGDSPELACWDFDKSWHAKIASTN